MKTKRLNIPLSADTHKAVKSAAAQRGVTVQRLVQATLAAAFSFQSPEPKPSREQR